jgi:hypothetical protein
LLKCFKECFDVPPCSLDRYLVEFMPGLLTN